MNISSTRLDDSYRQIFRNLLWPERTRNLDIERWVASCAKAGATSVCLDIKHQAFALYDSKLIPKDPVLGSRDFASELSAAARKHNLKWCAYIAPYQMETMRETHRGWQERLEDGSVFAEQGSGFLKTIFCWNSPYLPHFQSVLHEIASTYHPDAFYLDGMSFHGSGTRLTCFCDFCKARFETEYSRPLPSLKEVSDANKRDWILFLQARRKWIAEATRAVQQTVQAVDPGIALYLNNKFGSGDPTSSNSPAQFAHVDHLCREVIPQTMRGSLLYATYGFSAGDLFMWECATQRAAKGGRPGQLYVSLSPVARAEDIRLTVDLACAAGAQFTMQEHRSDSAGFLARIRDLEPYIKDATPLAEIALHYSEATLSSRCLAGPTAMQTARDEVPGLYKMMLDLHRPVEVIVDDDLDVGDYRNARLVMLPDSSVLSEKAKDRLHTYLEQGGTVIASMNAGIHNDFGEPITDTLVYEGSGLTTLGPITTRKPFYMRHEDGQVVFEEPTAADPSQYLIFKEGSVTDWLGEEIRAQGHPEPAEEREIFQLHDAPSMLLPVAALRIKADAGWSVLATLRFRDDVSGRWEETPAVVSRNVGRGRLIYACFQLGALFSEKTLWVDIGYAWSRQLVAHLIGTAIGPPNIQIKAPSCVKTAFWHQGEQTLIHLVNELSGLAPAVPMEERLPVAVTVRLSNADYRSVKVVHGGENGCRTKKKDGVWTLDCATLKDRILICCEPLRMQQVNSTRRKK